MLGGLGMLGRRNLQRCEVVLVMAGGRSWMGLRMDRSKTASFRSRLVASWTMKTTESCD